MNVIDKMEWEGVPPSDDRDWYRHCFGVRCRVWAVAGCYERTYYLDPVHLGENLRPLLMNTVWGIVEIIKSELIAAIDARPPSGVLSSVWQSDCPRSPEERAMTTTEEKLFRLEASHTSLCVRVAMLEMVLREAVELLASTHPEERWIMQHLSMLPVNNKGTGVHDERD